MKRGSWLRSEQGLQTLEWVALGLVILALMAAVAFFLTYRASESTGRTVTETVEALFECVQQLDFDCARDVLSAEGGRPEPPRDLIWCITHPLDCWREVVWPGIQKGAKWVWDRLVEVGRAIHQGAARVWDWLKKQWDTWLKGALAGLLAAALVILGIALLAFLGVITGGVAVIAAIAALIVGLLVGILSQLFDPKGGFWKYFANALTASTIAAGLVISGGIAIARGLIKEWLTSGLIPTAISMVIDFISRFDDLSVALTLALSQGKWGNLAEWFAQWLVAGVMTYLTTIATWGLIKALLPLEKYSISSFSRAIKGLFAFKYFPKTLTSLTSIAVINLGSIYFTGVLTNNPPRPEEYIVTALYAFLLWIPFEGLKSLGWHEWAVEFISQLSQKLSSWILRRLGLRKS